MTQPAFDCIVANPPYQNPYKKVSNPFWKRFVKIATTIGTQQIHFIENFIGKRITGRAI